MRARACSFSILIAATAAILAVALAGCGSSAQPSRSTGASSGFDGAALPPSGPAHAFVLKDQDGHAVSLSSGQVTILAFLTSTCGATCVLVAQQIRGALDELAKPVPTLLVSAGPASDTPSHIKRFLKATSLTGRVRYLTGSRASLAAVWRAYRIVPASAGKAAFDRSISVFVLDREGRARVLFQPEQLTPEGLAHDVRSLG
jgi:cytochrome oxidase Cu insertion factor (SCO1/SenC/PrrC family)